MDASTPVGNTESGTAHLFHFLVVNVMWGSMIWHVSHKSVMSDVLVYLDDVSSGVAGLQCLVGFQAEKLASLTL